MRNGVAASNRIVQHWHPVKIAGEKVDNRRRRNRRRRDEGVKQQDVLLKKSTPPIDRARLESPLLVFANF
jgi:hypothetical protein